MKGHIICLLGLWMASCQGAVHKQPPQLSDPIDTTWVDGPSDRRTLYAYPLQPIDHALWELTQTGAISLDEGWEAHCFATRGRGPHNQRMRLDPAWTYRELIARAAFSKSIHARHSGLQVEAEVIALDTTHQQKISMLKFRVKNLLGDTLNGLRGHIRLYDSSDTQQAEYLHILLHDTIFPNGWSGAFVSGVNKSPERLPNESEADFIKRRSHLIQEWADLLRHPAKQNWVFVPEEIRFLNGSGKENYGYEKTRKF